MIGRAEKSFYRYLSSFWQFSLAPRTAAGRLQSIGVVVTDQDVVTATGNGETTLTATIGDAWGHQFEATCRIKVGDLSGIREQTTLSWQMRVTTGHHCLYVEGVPEGQAVAVYSASGRQLFQGNMTGNKMQISLTTGGIYLVRSAQTAKKVVVR